jgi:hypothetical protein
VREGEQKKGEEQKEGHLRKNKAQGKRQLIDLQRWFGEEVLPRQTNGRRRS